MVPLILSLYGHPVAGNRWDKKMDASAREVGVVPAPGWKSIYRNCGRNEHGKTCVGEGAAMGVYVDDFEIAATPADTPKLCVELAKKIEFGDDYKIWDNDSSTAHLGVDYKVKATPQKNCGSKMTVRSEMGDYCRDLV